jgi:acyl carrier protein
MSAPEIAAQDMDLREQVSTYLAQYFMAAEALSEETRLVDDLGADSLDLLQVAYTLNEMFDIEIDADALPGMLTASGVCDLVERLRAGG